MKNRILLILFLIFVLINVVDIVTAFFIVSGEANPIFTLGGMNPLLIYKIVFLLFVFLVYKRNIYPSNFWYYLFVLTLVLGTLFVGLGAYSNSYGIAKPELVEAASKIPVEVRTMEYFKIAGVVYALPMIFSLIAFII